MAVDTKEVKKTSLKAYGDTRGTGGYWRDPNTGLISKLGSDGKPQKVDLGVVKINSDESRLAGKDIIDVDEGWGDKDSDTEDSKKADNSSTNQENSKSSRERYRDQQGKSKEEPKDFKYLNRGRDPGPRTNSPLKINGETMAKDYDDKDFRNFYGWVTDGNIRNINEAEDVLFKPVSKK